MEEKEKDQDERRWEREKYEVEAWDVLMQHKTRQVSQRKKRYRGEESAISMDQNFK